MQVTVNKYLTKMADCAITQDKILGKNIKDKILAKKISAKIRIRTPLADSRICTNVQ